MKSLFGHRVIKVPMDFYNVDQTMSGHHLTFFEHRIVMTMIEVALFVLFIGTTAAQLPIWVPPVMDGAEPLPAPTESVDMIQVTKAFLKSINQTDPSGGLLGQLTLGLHQFELGKLF